MAIVKRRGKRKDSTSGYFRQVLQDNPELLHSTSNEELINRWKADNPNHNERILKKVKQRLANLKSVLRRQERGGQGGRGKSTSRGTVRASQGSRGGRPTMATLEEHIDECLIMAKNLDRAGLESVIKQLRRARNEVVWKLGEK